MSWDEGFSRHYDQWSAGMTADIPFYVDLARDCDGPLVELAVGNGRVAIPVAQATNRPVIGIDSSPSMIEQARQKASDAGVDLDLRLGDMRDLSLDEEAGFGLIDVAGLEVEALYGDFDRTPINPNSREYIFVTVRR